MPLSNGQVLNNRYRIVSLLGIGGYGAVYKAWDTKLNGPCALKENFDASPPAEKQFAQEASILFNLRHPNLPMVFDYFSVPGQGLYLVMVFVEGHDLQQMLDKKQGRLEQSLVLPWIRQVCDALSYLHNQNPPVIHRDIKPANIKITPEGQAVLVDFGIAKVYDPKLKTTVGARAVTPGYSPPEQYGRGSTDARTDIYALGATLYALLTGSDPPDSVDLISGNETPTVEVMELNPEVTQAVNGAVRKAMQLDRARRFQTIDDFKTSLLAVSPTIQTSTKPSMAAVKETRIIPEEPEPVVQEPVKKRRSKAWLFIFLPVLVCVVAVALLFIVEPSREWIISTFEEVMGWDEPDYVYSEEEFPEPPEFVEKRDPDIERFEVAVDDDPVFGPDDAPVTIIEFGDFESDECRHWNFEIWPRLRDAFRNDIRLVYRDFPQEWVHENALSAASAAQCANEQGAYWEYHDALFRVDAGLGLPGYYIYAEDLQFDMDVFRSCYESERYIREVMGDFESAKQFGVEFAPTFFINGIRVDGDQPIDVFIRIIENELEGK